jgi:putative lipoic acid-binding regulatory protein
MSASVTPPGLSFPADYPIKVMGKNTAEFRATATAIILEFDPNAPVSAVTERESKQGRYLTLGYQLHLTTEENRDALYAKLKATDAVLFAL